MNRIDGRAGRLWREMNQREMKLRLVKTMEAESVGDKMEGDRMGDEYKGQVDGTGGELVQVGGEDR